MTNIAKPIKPVPLDHVLLPQGLTVRQVTIQRLLERPDLRAEILSKKAGSLTFNIAISFSVDLADLKKLLQHMTAAQALKPMQYRTPEDMEAAFQKVEKPADGPTQ